MRKNKTMPNAVKLKEEREGCCVGCLETARIKSDKKLQEKLKAGHKDAKRMKGRLVG